MQRGKKKRECPQGPLLRRRIALADLAYSVQVST